MGDHTEPGAAPSQDPPEGRAPAQDGPAQDAPAHEAPEHEADARAEREAAWSEDVLGPEFEARVVSVTGRGEHGSATLIRYRPSPSGPSSSGPSAEQLERGAPAERVAPDDRPARGTVVYVHGWSDYFANPELAATVDRAGYRFYALDLHGYGRNLTAAVLDGPDVPGYAEDVGEYREDLDAAVAVIRDDGAPAEPEDIVWIGHSTGGLVLSLAALSADAPPAGLALATPWLAPHVHDALDPLLVAVLRDLPPRWQRRPLPVRVASHYFRSLSESRDGEWPLDPQWRPERSFPLTGGFLLATSQARLRLLELHRTGAVVEAPVLVQTARRSLIWPWWLKAMRRRDTVLDVRRTRRRAGALSPAPRVIAYDGALHDVHRSARPVREQALDDLRRWLERLPAPR